MSGGQDHFRYLYLPIMIRQVLHKLRTDAGVRRYALNTGLLLGARGVQMILALVIGALMARYLGPAQYGIYNYVISFTGLFVAISMLGVGTIMVKDMLDKPETTYTVMGTGLWLRLAGSLLAILLVMLTGWFSEDSAEIRWFFVIASLPPIIKSFEVLTYYFQAKVLSKYSVIAQMTALCIVSALKVVFIQTGMGLDWFFYVMLLDATIITLITLVEYRMLKQEILHWKYDAAYAKQLLRASWPLIFSGFMVTIYLKIDQVMINTMLDETATGLYAAAVKLSEAWVSIPWIIGASLYPALVNAFKEDSERFSNRITQTYILQISVAMAIVVPVVLLAKPVTLFIFGEAYAASAVALQLHIGSLLFIFLGSVANRWLIIEGIQKYWMINSVIGAISNILLNLILIPAMGINGAALATLLSYAFAYHFAYAIPPTTRKVFHTQNRNFMRVCLVLPALRIMKKIKSR